MELVVRSLVFNVLFYLNLTLHVIVGLPTFLMPYQAIVEVAKSWGRTSNWLLWHICKIRVEFRNLDKIPDGPLLVASKHQSAWETFALMTLFASPVFILKRELQYIPLFGWYTIKGRMIPVDRGGGARALVAMAKRAHAAIATGRQLIIFPEGTRRAAGAEPAYKFGVAQLYEECEVPCLPIALNSGVFWPRRTFMRYPGTLVAECLDVIPPGLAKKDFFETIQNRIEEGSKRLVAEGIAELAAQGIDLPKAMVAADNTAAN